MEETEDVLPEFLYEIVATEENLEQLRTIAELGQLAAQVGQTIYVSSEHPSKPPRKP